MLHFLIRLAAIPLRTKLLLLAAVVAGAGAVTFVAVKPDATTPEPRPVGSSPKAATAPGATGAIASQTKPTTPAATTPTPTPSPNEPSASKTNQAVPAVVVPIAHTPVPQAQPTTPAVRSCPSFPAFPNASCTGVPSGTTLTASGAITVTTAGTVLDSFDFSGKVTIKAANVTIKNSKIHGGDYYGVQVVSGSVTITDSEIYGFTAAAIGFDNWSGYRLNIHSMGSDGLKLGSNTLLEDSYIHDFTTQAGAHADGAQMQAGETNITVRHNYIHPQGGENSALFFAPDLGPSASGPVIVDKNLLGGGNYTLYIVDGNNGQYHESGYSVTNNHFLRNAQYGVTDVNEPLINFTNTSGNVYDDNGQAITF